MSFERIPEVGKLVREESVPADEADMPVELRERALAVELMLFNIRLPSIKRYESLSPREFELTPAIRLKLSPLVGKDQKGGAVPPNRIYIIPIIPNARNYCEIYAIIYVYGGKIPSNHFLAHQGRKLSAGS